MGVVWVLLAIDPIAHVYWGLTSMAEAIGQLIVLSVLFALLMLTLEWLKRRGYAF